MGGTTSPKRWHVRANDISSAGAAGMVNVMKCKRSTRHSEGTLQLLHPYDSLNDVGLATMPHKLSITGRRLTFLMRLPLHELNHYKFVRLQR